MQGVRDFGNALLIALISAGLMVGALSISLVEFVPEATPTATNNLPPSPMPLTATATLLPTLTPTFSIESPTPTMAFTSTITATPPAYCQVPFGWSSITVQIGDTLSSIAANYRISVDVLRRSNCLYSDELVAGTHLWVPAAATNTPVVCNQGAVGWAKIYVVQPHDTFYSIATNYYQSVSLLKHVNCRTSDLIYSGERLWVPNISTRTPYPTPLPGSTVTPFPTDPLTETALPFTATFIPTETSIPPTQTPVPTITPPPTTTPSLTAFP